MNLLAWTDQLPADWEAKPLRSAADYVVSNVDKVSDDDEIPVRLCNYTDVYNNEFITPALDFMHATASEAEIAKFGLAVDDVLITKDSESWDDIGVPALVRETANDLVCGYHLAVLRPLKQKMDGAFLFRCLQAKPVRVQLELAANGVTRFGIPKSEIGTMTLPVPPLPQQHAITDYLDRETARLDTLVAAKERVLGLLAEKHQALITRAVSRGLNPGVPLRDSRIPWLGEIPAHWEVWKLGHCASVGNGSTPSRGNASYWTEGTFPWLNSSVVNQSEVTKADQFVTDLALRECHLPLVKSGSVLVAITGQGKTRGQAVVLSFDATINQHIAYISSDHSRLDPWFLRWTLLSAYESLRSISDDAGGTKGALTCEDVANFRVPVPPIGEQRAIVAYIANETSKLDELRTATEKTTELLRERRTSLISTVVTGIVDVESAACR